MKPGVYEVYSCVPFEQNDVVIKILHGSDIMAEMKNWAQAGYLVAYAAENVRPTTYLILRVATPKGEVPQGERYQNLMQNVRESASKSYALAYVLILSIGWARSYPPITVVLVDMNTARTLCGRGTQEANGR